MKKAYLIAIMALFTVGQTAYAQCTCTAGCDSRTTIPAGFSYGGEGEFCWEATELGTYAQSWGCDVLEITGVDYTNIYVPTGDLLRDASGKYYIYYKAGANGSFHSAGDSIVGCCPGGCNSRWCTCEQYGDMEFDGFNLNNNTWGATEGSQCIWADSYDDWGVHAEFPETSGVKSYPRVGKHLNTNISQLGGCTSSFNVSVPTSGSHETAYDIWVPSEVMIWMNKYGAVGPIAEGWDDQGNPIPSATNVTVGGHTWDVYHGGSNVVSFVRQGNTNSGTVGIGAILNWIKNQGWIGDGPVGSLEFGFEITSAPGGLDFTLNDYSLSVGGGTTSTTTTAATTSTTTTAATTSTTTTAATTSTTTTAATTTTTAATTTTTAAGGVLTSADFESGFGEWVNVTGDTHDWTRDSGGTPSSSTGPSTGANGSTWYVFLETSSGGANTAGDTAYLEGPDIGGDNRTLTFYYHMYGSNMGTLNVDVYSGGSWDNGVWSISGQQHTSSSAAYTQATVNLGAYSGTIRVRFRAVAAGSYRGDMAIDDIEITGGGATTTTTSATTTTTSATTTTTAATTTTTSATTTTTAAAGLTAYYCDVDSMSSSLPMTVGGNLNSKTEATSSQYTAIASSDNSRWTTSDPGSRDEVFLWLENSVTDSGITSIDLTFEGYLSGSSATFSIWARDVANGTWDQIGTTQSIATGSDGTMTRSITSEIGNYVSGQTLIWGVYESTSSQSLNIDYVNVVVNTGGTTTTTAATTTTTSATTTTTSATTTTTSATTTTTAATTTTTAATTTTTAAAGCTCDSGCDGTSRSAPFTQNGSGTYCWQVTSMNYINSWSLNKLEINDVDYTNVWSNSFPAQIGGVWYIYYDSSRSWGHFEAN